MQMLRAFQKVNDDGAWVTCPWMSMVMVLWEKMTGIFEFWYSTLFWIWHLDIELALQQNEN